MSRPPYVLGIDLSLRATGIAHGSSLVDLWSDTLFPPKGWSDDRRRAWISRGIVTIAEDVRPTLILIESEITPGGRPTNENDRAVYMAHGLVRADLMREGWTFGLIKPKGLKLLALGKGGGPGTDKPAMVAAAKEHLGMTGIGKDDNRADSGWLTVGAAELIGRPFLELPERNLTALEHVAWPNGMRPPVLAAA